MLSISTITIESEDIRIDRDRRSVNYRIVDPFHIREMIELLDWSASPLGWGERPEHGESVSGCGGSRRAPWGVKDQGQRSGAEESSPAGEAPGGAFHTPPRGVLNRSFD